MHLKNPIFCLDNGDRLSENFIRLNISSDQGIVNNYS